MYCEHVTKELTRTKESHNGQVREGKRVGKPYSTLSSLRVVVANDDCASGGSAAFGTSGSCVKLYVTAGAVYAIQVSGFGAAKGLATLSLSMRT